MKLHGIKIGLRLSLGFGTLMILLIVTGSLAIGFGRSTSQAVAEVERTSLAVSDIKDMWLSLRQMRAGTWYYVATGDEQGRQDLASAYLAFEQQYATIDTIVKSDTGRGLLAQLHDFANSYRKSFSEICDLRYQSGSASSSEIKKKIEETKGLTSIGLANLQKLIEFETTSNGKAQSAANDRIALAETWSTLVGVFGVALGAACAWIIGRSIARPITAMTSAMTAIARGDFKVDVPALSHRDEVGAMAHAVQIFLENGRRLAQSEHDAVKQERALEQERQASETARLEIQRQQQAVVAALARGLDSLSKGDLTGRLDQVFAPDYEKLRADFNATASSLETALRTIAKATDAIGSGSDEIAQASDDLSRRTEQQAANLEETAAALNLITGTVKKMAAGAGEASKVVAATRDTAQDSGAVVREAVEAMGKIKGSSNEITQIIGVIDEIAFQTNLLALNAGVEAARAGDAGRGFAVVASEVRGLAQRSAEAAKEIKTLISASSTQVESGVVLVARTGEALKGIIDRVSQLDVLVHDISSSSQEQATGLAEVNTAVNQMDKVVQQNAAMVEESTAAAHALRLQSEGLTNMVGRFQIRGASSTHVNPVHAAQNRLAAFARR